MLRSNETRHIKWHETCKCKYGLDASVCNNKQCCGDDKCRVNAMNQLIKECMIEVFVGILVIMSVTVINDVMLVSIQTMKIVSVEKNWLINQLKHVLKMLK